MCNVLQARTLFDLGDPDARPPSPATASTTPAEPATSTSSASPSTQIAQIAIADGDSAAAVAAATEALALQERIGYTEGTVSALHVLGQAHRLAGDIDAAPASHHRRALALAVADRPRRGDVRGGRGPRPRRGVDRPGPRRARCCGPPGPSGARRGLPLRQRDAEELADARSTTSARTPPRPRASFDDLVAELTR